MDPKTQSPGEVVERLSRAIELASLALGGLNYAVLSFPGEPLEVVEGVAKYFGVPLKVYRYTDEDKRPYVLVGPAWKIGPLHVSLSTGRLYSGVPDPLSHWSAKAVGL